MSDLTRAEKKAEEVRQQTLRAMISFSARQDDVAAVVTKTEETADLKKSEQIMELEQKIVALEGAKAKLVDGFEKRLRMKDVTIVKLKQKLGDSDEIEAKRKELEAKVKEQEEKLASLQTVEEQNRQLQLDLNHLQEKTGYDNKVFQEALTAANENLSSKVEENNRLQNNLVDLLSKLQVRSKMTKALCDLDKDIAEISNRDGLKVPDSYASQIYQACDAIDVDQITKSLNHVHVEERDDSPEQAAEIKVNDPMKMLASVLACGGTMPLSAE